MATVDLQSILGNTTFASGFSGWSGYSGYSGYIGISGYSGYSGPTGEGFFPIVVVSGTTQTAVSSTHYILSNGGTSTLTLPASPADGDIIWVTVVNGLNSNVIARNGKNIQGLAEDLTIDIANTTVRLRYINNTYMWRII